MARQSERLAEIRRLLQSEAIYYQRDLVERLTQAGFAVTQSSVSRDLRTLRAVKLDGRYVLPDHIGTGTSESRLGSIGPDGMPLPAGINGNGGGGPTDDPFQERLRDVAALREIRQIRPAGPHLIVIHTGAGFAPRIGLVLDRMQWEEIVGTIAGDDCVFVATNNPRAYRRFHDRITPFLRATATQS